MIARRYRVPGKRAIVANGAHHLLVDQHLGSRHRFPNLQRGHARQRRHLELQADLGAFLNVGHLGRGQLESVLGDAHGNAAERRHPQLAPLRLTRVFLAVQEHARVVLGGGND